MSAVYVKKNKPCRDRFFHSPMNHQNINLKAYNLFIVQKNVYPRNSERHEK